MTRVIATAQALIAVVRRIFIFFVRRKTLMKS